MDAMERSDDWLPLFLGEFEDHFGHPPAAMGTAPGRVNLIGEHTDYSEGLVLPCAIDREIVALAAPRRDGRIRVWARDLADVGEFDPACSQRVGTWLDYVQAVAFALRASGHEVDGLDLAISGRVSLGSGLSSSAALGLSVLGVIDVLQDLQLDARSRARIVHRGECDFVGVGCGIMDQFASALGRRDHALRIDCRSQEVRPVPMKGTKLGLLLMHTGVQRELAHGAYPERVAACREAAAAARREGVTGPDVRTLRDLSSSDLPRLERALEPVLFRRARHVITENERVDEFCQGLARGDHALLGRLLEAGQRSLRDDYEVSIPELDTLCELAADLPGVVGSRLTGAGFGGCTLHLVDPDRMHDISEALAAGFERSYRRRPEALAVRPADGARARLL